MGEINKKDVENCLKYVWEQKRLESFKLWPFDNKCKCNKHKMAEAGFFWSGTEKDPDSAQCFVCGKQLDGWESTDDPWYEHTHHANKCLFVTLGKVEDDLTLSEVYDIHGEIFKNLINKREEKEIKKIENKYKEMLELLKNIKIKNK